MSEENALKNEFQQLFCDLQLINGFSDKIEVKNRNFLPFSKPRIYKIILSTSARKLGELFYKSAGKILWPEAGFFFRICKIILFFENVVTSS